MRAREPIAANLVDDEEEALCHTYTEHGNETGWADVLQHSWNHQVCDRDVAFALVSKAFVLVADKLQNSVARLVVDGHLLILVTASNSDKNSDIIA